MSNATDGMMNKLWSLTKRVVLNSQGLPIILSISVLGILLVLFRMKSVEQNYRLNEIAKQIDEASQVGKELKAKKAKRMSIKNLRRISKKYNLEAPKQNQIIVIP